MSGSITWLGHAAFRFDTPAGDRIYVDPWLTGNPSCPASELVGAPRVIPSHYATFGLLTGTPKALRELLPAGIELVAPQPGETIAL